MSKSPFSILMSELAIGSVTVRNRILSTGHDTSMAASGEVSDQLIAYQEARAAGGIGLIVIQVAGVHESARYTSHVLMADTDACIDGYRRLAAAIHRHGAKVFGQLFHPGKEILETPDGTIPVAYAPSAIPNSRFHIMPVALTKRKITEIIEGYASAARRLKTAGLDGCEIVASHGYLPAQFLNPRSNARQDEYGGSLENRMRFLHQIADAVRAAVGRDFVVGARITGEELDRDAIDPNEVLSVCVRLDQASLLDYFSVTAGTSASLQGAMHLVPAMCFNNAYAAPFAGMVKAQVSVPVFVTGRINQPQTAEKILAEGQADMCGMTRAAICDPEFPVKIVASRAEDIRACIACNQACIGHIHKGFSVSCLQHPETGREREYGTRVPARDPKRILIAGGGPAGMKAAAVLAERGHRVTLCEAGESLGGQVLLAQLLPNRAEFGGAATNLKREMELASVEVRLRTRVDRALVERLSPDSLVVATGATPRWPDFDGRDVMSTYDAWQILRRKANVGASVVIADWRCDWIGIGLAELLASEGSRVRLCVEGVMVGETLPWYVRDPAVGALHKRGVEVVTYVRLFGADETAVYFTHAVTGDPVVIEGVQTLVLSQGHVPDTSLASELEGLDLDVHYVGDCLSPRTAEEAILEGLKIGTRL